MVDRNYENLGDFEARSNGPDMYILGPLTETYLRPSLGRTEWRNRTSSMEEPLNLVTNLPSEAVQQCAATLFWMSESVKRLRTWINLEVQRQREGKSDRILPPEINIPSTSIQIPHVNLAPHTNNTVEFVDLPGDYGTLILNRSGEARWKPKGLSPSGPAVTLNLPTHVVQEALISIADTVNAFNWLMNRANEARSQSHAKD